jgi:hypothetical protein
MPNEQSDCNYYDEEVARRNYLKHFNGRRDRLAKMPHLNAHPCHQPATAMSVRDSAVKVS